MHTTTQRAGTPAEQSVGDALEGIRESLATLCRHGHGAEVEAFLRHELNAHITRRLTGRELENAPLADIAKRLSSRVRELAAGVKPVA